MEPQRRTLDPQPERFSIRQHTDAGRLRSWIAEYRRYLPYVVRMEYAESLAAIKFPVYSRNDHDADQARHREGVPCVKRHTSRPFHPDQDTHEPQRQPLSLR